MIWIFLLGGLIVLGLIVVSIGSSLTAAEQARATIAASEAAKAASMQNIIMMVLIGVIVIMLIVLAITIVLYLTKRQNKGQWASGPNANFGRIGGQPQQPQLPRSMDPNTMMMLMMMSRMMGQDMPRLQPPKSPAQQDQEDDWGWWNV
jgi:hypothetical protein